ncbi:MAG: hypothetical protein HPY76_09590 [Anaerolineae bacterium]|nr:hypothetical protein [Anaerolineae bacterium]
MLPGADNMQGRKQPPAGILAVFLLVAIILSSCSSDAFPRADKDAGIHAVDASLKEFYRSLGKEWLGAPISPLISVNNANCQYTVNVLMCTNPAKSDASRFFLAKLGTQVGVAGNPVNSATMIYPDFIPVVDHLGGLGTIGQPLTEPIYNYQEQRVEQYFESAALFHNFADSPGTVSLLPLGSTFCGSNCTYDTPLKLSISKYQTTEAFRQHFADIAWERIAGRALTDVYTTGDGREMEQVFENMVVYAPVDEPGNIRLRNLPILLNMTATPPRAPEADPRLVFYPIQGEQGYPVPVQFDRYITAHGGTVLSGTPIAETLRYSANGNVPRQCFQNYCLDFYTTPDERFQTRPAPLGLQYLNKLDLAAIRPITTADANVIIQTSETYSQAAADANQVIRVLVHKRSTMKPYPGVVPLLDVYTPNGQEYRFIMGTSDDNGRSEITLPILPDVQDGTVISYRVCVRSDLGHATCKLDGYLIWNE